MARSLAATLALVLAGPAVSGERPAIAGLYSGMPVGYDAASGVISGYFSEATGGGQFSCIFYFAGQLRGNRAAITSYFPASPADKIPGSLVIADDGSLAITLTKEHGGCWNVRHFADPDEPARFSMDVGHPEWTSIAVVKRERSYFHADASDRSRKRTYVVRGDAVAIRTTKPGWHLVDYSSGGGTVSGYLKSTDLYGMAGAQ